MSQKDHVLTALGYNGMPIQALRPGERLGTRLNANDDDVSTYAVPGINTPRVIQVSTVNRPAYLRIKRASDATAFDLNANAFLIPQNMFLYFTVLPGDEVQIRRVANNNSGWQIFLCHQVEITQVPQPPRTTRQIRP